MISWDTPSMLSPRPWDPSRREDPVNQDELYLRPIIDAADVIASSVTVGREQFLADTLREDAVIRRLETIGEATKRLSLELRARHSDIA